MIATEANWKDIQKYYQGTYITCPEYSPDEALYIDSVTPTGIRVMDVEGVKGFIETPYEIVNPLVLRRQYYQVVNTTYYISRIPARMWKKGLSGENTIIQKVQTNGSLSGALNGFAQVHSFFKHHKSFVETIPEDLPEYGCALALSPHWMLHLNGANTLFLLGSPVAKVSHPKKLVSMLKEFSKIPLPKALKDWTVAYV